MTKNLTVEPGSETESLFIDLDRPSLAALSYILRHPDTWPKDFIWNFGDCYQCAMGLAHRLWKQIPRSSSETGATIMAREFAIPYGVALNIFLADYGHAEWLPRRVEHKTEGRLWWKKEISTSHRDYDAVTPEMVADQIDAFLKGQ